MPGKRKISAVQLRVVEAKQRDIGKNYARLDTESMKQLKISPGDVVEVVGKKNTVAVAWPTDPEEETLSILRIDGQTRKNAGALLNEFATVRKMDWDTAKSVTLTPIATKIPLDKEFAEFVRNRLKGRAVVMGDEISVMILGNPILFRVHKVRPKECVKIEQSTSAIISAEPVVNQRGVQAVTYEEIGGLKEEIRRLREIIELPLRHPEVFQKLGIEPPNGILLHGPPGCGKTLLARAIANECEANFYSLNGPEIMNKYYGETESRLRDLFKEAKGNAPSIIFIDEIDALAPRREDAFGDVEKRVVGQLLALMDGVAERGDVVVIGATNRPESIDPALRRPGRFDREIQIGVPNPDVRLEILRIHTRGMPLSSDVDLDKIAATLYGYTGADIRALCREAALVALRRYSPGIDIETEQLTPDIIGNMEVRSGDFRDASRTIVPTAMREFFAEEPKVSWEEIGGLQNVKRTLFENVVWAIKDQPRFQKIGVSPAKGILLYGPPGCGKTILARALATESKANLITVKGPEILSKWMGESEKAIREIFKKAKASSPCIVFFDELDSIAATRTSALQQSDRVLSQLLAEIDTSGSSGDIFILGATNRPDLIDVSLLRPGRIDLMVYTPSPDEFARNEILNIHTKKMPLSSNVDLKQIAIQTKGYSGADIQSVCREAAIEAMRRNSESPLITQDDFLSALSRIKPALSVDVDNWFQGMEKRLKSSAPSSGFIG